MCLCYNTSHAVSTGHGTTKYIKQESSGSYLSVSCLKKSPYWGDQIKSKLLKRKFQKMKSKYFVSGGLFFSSMNCDDTL